MISDYKIIAVCSAAIDTNYNDHFLKAFSTYAEKYHFRILFFNAFSDLYRADSQGKHDIGESRIYHLMNYKLIDAVVVLSETIKCDMIRTAIIEKAKFNDIPVISIDHFNDDCININFDYKTALRKILNHLIEDHHYTKINFIAGIKGNMYSEERIAVYKDVLTAHGLPIEEERIGYGGFWSLPTKKVINDFVSSDLPFPDAIACANDTMAIAAFHFLTEMGYNIPDDVAITGFDGIAEAIDHLPAITTAQHDSHGAVIKSFELLTEYFKGNTIPKQTQLESKLILGGSCGCPPDTSKKYSLLSHLVYDKLDDQINFNSNQITMAADLTDNDSFHGVFDNLMRYADNFYSNRFWLCIVDNFLSEDEELSDIIEESSFRRVGYSSHMDIMLARRDRVWEGMTDFETDTLLPKLETILEEEGNIMFLPLHVLDQTIGYVALVYDSELMNMEHLYQFLMNISNALETTKTHQRQQNIISTLENKYIHDPLTGLYNRRGFYQQLAPKYDTCINNQSQIMVISADLNGLKYINDTFGHADGDIAISTVARALNAASSFEKVCARFGGDEFVLAGPVVKDAEIADFKSKFYNYLSNFNLTSGKPYEVSASIGIVVGFPNAEITLDEFIKAADEEMYKDKAKYHMNRI